MKIQMKHKKKSFYLIATSDIAFLLLIFLVVTSSFEYSQEITPPETSYVEELDREYESVAIEIDEQGRYSLLAHYFVLEEISQVISVIPESTVIKIFADKNVDFVFVTKLMDALQQNKRTNVFLMMEKVFKK